MHVKVVFFFLCVSWKLLFVSDPHKKMLDVDVLDYGYKWPCRLYIHRHKAYFIVV